MTQGAVKDAASVFGETCSTAPTRERRAGVKVPILVPQTNSDGTTGYIWCHKTRSCADAVMWPSRAINGPNGRLNIAGGAHLEPSCLADGTRPGSPGHLLDSHKHELAAVRKKYCQNHESNHFWCFPRANKQIRIR